MLLVCARRITSPQSAAFDPCSKDRGGRLPHLRLMERQITEGEHVAPALVRSLVEHARATADEAVKAVGLLGG
jgi:hypothetical protein